MSYPEEKVRAAIGHLSECDPVLGGVIDAVGPFTLRLERNRFQMLVRSIVSQQISMKVARIIRQRIEALVAPGKITPESIAALSIDQLRGIGLSANKASYVLDLATKVQSRTVRLRSLHRMTDEEVIAELIQVRGIGVWTAQMLMMFSLGRMDVLPHADLGIRMAMRNLYGLSELPGKAACEQIAAPWRPYATIASWYCWRSLDLKAVNPLLAKEFPG